MSKRKRKKIINNIGKIIAIIGLIITCIFAYYVLRLNILPTKYVILLALAIIFIYGIMYIFIFNKKIKTSLKIFASIILLTFAFAFIFGIKYIDRTIAFLDRINNNLSQTEEYYLYALKDSEYESISDYKNKKIGFYKSNTTKSIKTAVDTLNKKIKFEEKDYDDAQLLLEALQNKEIDAILVSGSLKAIFEEDYSYIMNKIKVITTVLVPIETSDIVKIVDVTNTPFNVYLIGSDTYGSINRVSNSDVNIIITINPKTNQILLTSIPRDYYVMLYGYNEERKTVYEKGMDKLTHSGYYGIETSVKTVEKLLNTEINYYARVNFTSVIEIVDSIGGIEVYSDYSFCDSGRVGCYKKGYNKLNGTQALAFARERKSFKGGDRVRGENQQKVIASIINKMTSSTQLIKKYDTILSKVEKSFQTNMDENSMTKLVKYQLNKMPKWEIINQNLNGSDKTVYEVFSFKNDNGIYVMQPNRETVDSAKEKIKEILSAK